MPRYAITLAAALVAAPGCAHRTAAVPAAVVAYHPGGRAETATAPATAVYALYRGRNDEVVVTRYLTAGAPLGFKRASDGEVRAVAAQDRLPLPTEPHRWAVDPDEPRRRREQNTRAAVTAAYRKYDRVAERVGTVLYPPLVVIAIPLGVLAGGPGGQTNP